MNSSGSAGGRGALLSSRAQDQRRVSSLACYSRPGADRGWLSADPPWSHPALCLGGGFQVSPPKVSHLEAEDGTGRGCGFSVPPEAIFGVQV